jgi:PIN domain nuclease of toxin-antitoxin system
VRLLLDTHALIWWFLDSPRMPERIKLLIDDPRNRVYVSAVTSWELATKFRIGKLPEAKPLVQGFFDFLEEWHFEKLPISVEHGHRAGLLPGEHKDPFDRMLAAQAILEELDIVTVDPALAALGANVIW